MWVIALIQAPKVIDKTLRSVCAKGRDARGGQWATGPAAGGAARGATALETRME